MQAGSGYKKITFKILIPGEPDGTGGTIPGTGGEQEVLTTRCSYEQERSQIVLQAMQFGTNDVFKVIIRKRASFAPLALIHKAYIDSEEYVIQQVLEVGLRDYKLYLTRRR